MVKSKFYNRELSWLSFNYRVLQEAKNVNVPLFERIKFLAIFSSNLDEFYQVRVASLRSLLKNNFKDERKIKRLLNNIYNVVDKQQNEYGLIIKDIFLELERNKIFLLNDSNISDNQLKFIKEYFELNLLHLIQPTLIAGKRISLFLNNKSIYLAVKMKSLNKDHNEEINTTRKIYKYALVNIPSDEVSRFVILPESNGNKYVMFLDDVIKINLPSIFSGYKIEEFYSIKLTRDAELYIDDEFSGNLLNKIKKSLVKRTIGEPSRFLYDFNMDKNFVTTIKKYLKLKKEDLIQGGKYHNLNDLFNFPKFNLNNLEYEKLTPIVFKEFEKSTKMCDVIESKDIILNFPYHSYNHVVKFLEEAANDKNVKSIKITLYRTSPNSKIIKYLIDAAKNGIKVTAFVEIKARFDEEANINNADMLEKEGIKVLYSLPGMKVHCKICLIEKLQNNVKKYYAYLSTGNFNEKTANIYSDFGLFTSNKILIDELKKVFKYLSNNNIKPKFNNILVAPFNLRKKIYEAINNEIYNAKEHKKSKIILKLNSLEDKKIISKLYEASNAGVEIFIIVRGICSLIPGVKGLSENIRVISIVDRYLEHSRIFYFYNNGNENIYLSSADWMTRNLNRRIELAFPIFDKNIKEMLKSVLELQMNDNVKARIINKEQNNIFVEPNSNTKIQSQLLTYRFFEEYSL